MDHLKAFRVMNAVEYQKKKADGVQMKCGKDLFDTDKEVELEEEGSYGCFCGKSWFVTTLTNNLESQ